MKIKKLLCLALAFIMVLALSACGNSPTPTQPTPGSETSGQTDPDTNAAPEETFVFRHGFDLDYPPYSYLDDNGNIGGFDVEMCQALCDYLGWEYVAVPFNWDAKDMELNSGAADCIWSGFTIEGREDSYEWSIAYSDNTQMILVPNDSDIKTLEDLAGKVIGVQTSTSAYDLLMKEGSAQAELCATFAELMIYDTYTIAFADLQAGAIDAIAIDITVGNFLIDGVEGYGYLDEVLGIESYGIGFRLGDTELRDTVNEALLALVADGTYDAIGQKYPTIYDYLCLN